MIEIQSTTIDVEGLNFHYLEAGRGLPVLLLHGWPTSSFLWRNVMPAIAEHRRVIAVDLPGFGRSDKPLDVSYSFRYFRRALDGFLEQLGIDRLGLAVHDLGGPVGLYWASQQPERIERLALLNTVVYPEVSWAVKLFGLACRMPGMRGALSSPWGLERALHLGVANSDRLRDDAVAGTLAPFADRDARRALLKAGCGLNPKGLQEIARWLPTIRVPVAVVYGARDRILPDIAKTVERVQGDIPGVEVTKLEDCGHFLQEERPEEVGKALADFFKS